MRSNISSLRTTFVPPLRSRLPVSAGSCRSLTRSAGWDRILSEGEKQRLAIARLLLHRPDVIALDEATSALHVEGQAELMAAIARELPEATIISIGHRPELEGFHDRKLSIARKVDGAVIVADAPVHPVVVGDGRRVAGL